MQPTTGARVLVDGVSADCLPVDDRGLLYGDGLFETIAVVDGRPCLWARHMSRLRQGCGRLGLPPPDPDLLLARARMLLDETDRAVLKILVTRGSGGRGYSPPRSPVPRQVLVRADWPSWPADWLATGVRVRRCTTGVAESPALAGLKHIGRLEQVLARAEWRDPDIAEGLMSDAAGNLIEGTRTNLFVEHRGRLLTPALGHAGVAGVMRGLVMDTAAQLGAPVSEVALTAAAVKAADALYLTNSLIGAWRVREFDGRPYALDRAPHAAVAAAVQQAYGP